MISVGEGTIAATGSFLSYKPSMPYEITALSVSNLDFMGVTWEFSQISGVL